MKVVFNKKKGLGHLDMSPLLTATSSTFFPMLLSAGDILKKTKRAIFPLVSILLCLLPNASGYSVERHFHSGSRLLDCGGHGKPSWRMIVSSCSYLSPSLCFSGVGTELPFNKSPEERLESWTHVSRGDQEFRCRMWAEDQHVNGGSESHGFLETDGDGSRGQSA